MAVDLVQIRMMLTGGEQVAAESKAAQAEIAATGTAAETASKKQIRGSGAIGKSLKEQGASMKRIGGGMKKYLTVPLVGLAAASVGFAVQFDKSMRNVNSIAGLPEAQFKKLSASVLALAGPTNQAPNTLAEGLYDLVSSGFNASQSLKILKSSARAASAGLTTTEVSTKAIAAALNSYHLPASKAREVSDILFETVNKGVITFDELSSQLGYVVSTGNAAGIGLKELGAEVSTLTLAGQVNGTAITNLNQAITAFLKPSKGMKEAVQELGYANAETLLKQKGFQGGVEALSRVADGSKEKLASYFGNVRAARAVYALTGDGAKKAQKNIAAFNDVAGSTSKVFKEQEKSFSFKVTQALHEAQVALIELAPALLALTPIVVGIVNGFVKLSEVFLSLPKPVQTVILVIAGLVALAGPVLSLIGAIVALGVSLATIGIVVGIAAAVIALGVAFFVAYEKIGWFHNAVDAVFGFVKSHWRWLLIPLAPIIGPFLVIVANLGHLKTAWGWIKTAVQNVVNFVKGSALGKVLSAPIRFTIGVIEKAIEAYKTLKGFLDGLSGGTNPEMGPGAPEYHRGQEHNPGQKGLGSGVNEAGGPENPFTIPEIGGETQIRPAGGAHGPRVRRGSTLRPSARARGVGASRGRRTTAAPVQFMVDKRILAEGVVEVQTDDEARL